MAEVHACGVGGDEMKKVGGGVYFRLYKSRADRARAVAALKERGRNYFVGFQDADQECPFGLSFGYAKWMDVDQIYRKRC